MKTKTKRNELLLKEATELYSAGYVKQLKEKGLDIIEGERLGTHVYDISGKTYIDCYTSGGIYNLGRKNEELISTLLSAARKVDQGNFVMLSEEKALLAEKLSHFVPGNLDCVLYTVVRGEPVDAACKLARGHTGRKGLIAVDGGWYGQTGFAMTMSERADKKMFGPLIPDVTIVPFGDVKALKKAVSRKTAAVFMEPVQSENGCRIADPAYYKAVRKICTGKEALLVFDETQTGFGRTGKKFAYEYFDIEPDILLLGEAMGGGVFPMTALMFSRETKKFFDRHPLIDLHTFGGHDVGCIVAMKALEMYEDLKPWENAALMGEKLNAALSKIASRYQGKIAVRGIGLLQSLIFAAPETARRFCREAGRQGLLTVQGEVAANSVVFRPSLTINFNDVLEIESCVRKALDKVM